MLLGNIAYAQPKPGMPSEPGKCYARCIIQDQYETIETEFLEFLGIYSDSLDYLKKIQIEDETELIDLVIVTNPKATEDFENVKIERRVLVKQGGFNEWREVVCDSDITPHLYSNVQQALIDEGYDVGPSGANGKIGKGTKEALVQFQKDNGLPVGQLDFESLRMLNVR